MPGRRRDVQVTVLQAPSRLSDILALDTKTVIVIVAIAAALTALIANAFMGARTSRRVAGTTAHAHSDRAPREATGALTPAPPPG
jgi:hypothetical protein